MARARGHGPASGVPASGIPARGTRSFEPGHELSIRHGAFSRYAVAESDELASVIAQHAPHLAEIDALGLRDYAIAQVRAWRIAAYIEANGELTDDGTPRPALNALALWLGRAERARARLGLDPMSRAALAIDELNARRSANALEAEQLAEGRRLRLEAEARLNGRDSESSLAAAERASPHDQEVEP
jgi:hypothetical protein